ncbi:phosphotransferase [Geodermatophilus sp. URMC 61]|uniref:phosphotransferase n=1 Tax=Geodermatophilus sp. URMC 61 TaxID=3423411 RepID=UPI00406D08C1
MPRESEPEVLLHGGTANRGQVVRVGDTVRRPQRATSPATHALLCHLADVGFAGAPRFLGVDEHGREVLSYVPGTAITPPYPAWALTDDALVSVAQLLRDYHRAVSTFDQTAHTWPPSPPAPFAGGLVSHNDVNLDNVVFRGGRAVALIDFDLASPGSRIWDVACAARLWAPLRPDTDIVDTRRGRAVERFRLLVDSYGLDRGEREAVVRAVLRNHDWCYDVVGTAAANGHAAFSEYLVGGAQDRAERARRWYADNADRLREALL